MPAPPALSDAEIEDALATVAVGWSKVPLANEGSGLVREYDFQDFRTAIAFMSACVADIERANHHPIWENKYNRVTVTASTWDAGNRITSLDVDLARLLDRFAEAHDAKNLG